MLLAHRGAWFVSAKKSHPIILVCIMLVLYTRALELSAVSFGGTSDDYGWGITSFGSNKVAVTGSFKSTATFGDVVLTSKGSRDAYITIVRFSTLVCAIS